MLLKILLDIWIIYYIPMVKKMSEKSYVPHTLPENNIAPENGWLEY